MVSTFKTQMNMQSDCENFAFLTRKPLIDIIKPDEDFTYKLTLSELLVPKFDGELLRKYLISIHLMEGRLWLYGWTLLGKNLQ